MRPALRPLAALLAAVLGASAAADDTPPDLDRLRTELDLLWLDASADHEHVREEGFYEALRPFAPCVRHALAERAKTAPRIEDSERAEVARAIAAAALAEAEAAGEGPAPLRRRTLEFLLHRALPAELASFVAEHDDAWFVAFLAGETRQILAADRFEDAWDAVLREAPAVLAWRRAHAPATERGTSPSAPDPKERPPTSLVEVDASRAWVGPWTGWISDIREKDNRRAKRTARTFWIERHEVTCEAYAEFLRALDPSRRADFLPSGWAVGEGGEPRFPEGRGRHPVTGVSWAAAAAYAESRGMRLPTEDEWDRTAGGGEKEGRAFPWGASATGRTWAHAGAGVVSTSPVDAFPEDVTPEGVVGLGGNVAEWTATLADRRDVPRGGPGAHEQVVVRGGSWRAREAECTATYRRLLEAGKSGEHVGFRCVMDDAEYRRRARPGTDVRPQDGR